MAFDGRRHWYEGGYSLKFEIRRVPPTPERTHGLRYSFTLHDPKGKRLVGFDNAHAVKTKRKGHRTMVAADHWHRTERDKGLPYTFESAERLLDDFFAEVEKVLIERGVPLDGVLDEDVRSSIMKTYRLQSHAALKKEMKAVARRAKAAPATAAVPSFNSVAALLRLLTPENRDLLAVIRNRRPQSIAELAKLTGRAAPNLTRTLGKLEAVGFVRMDTVEKRKVPKTLVQTLRLRIDPFSMNDRLDVA